MTGESKVAPAIPGEPEITVVMSPRERFSGIQRSIDSLYQDLGEPFVFICVDGGSPRTVKRYLAAEARRRGFRLIRTEQYLTPNEARNLAIPEVTTKYVVFVDNDIIFARGWLGALKRCSEETDADIVSPLICIGEPIHSNIHFAGGAAAIVTESGRRVFREAHHFSDRHFSEVRNQLCRQSTELAEFHCMFVKKKVFERSGLLDEKLKSLHEHIDLCLTVRENGGIVMFEPHAVVTYVLGTHLRVSDLPFYLYRWSDEWALASEVHFHRKWDVAFNDNTTRSFVIPHRRLAWSRVREFMRMFIGWRLSMFLYDKVAEELIRLARWRRRRALA